MKAAISYLSLIVVVIITINSIVEDQISDLTIAIQQHNDNTINYQTAAYKQ